MNKQYEFIEFVFEYVYVDLQYDEIFLTLLLGLSLLSCSSPWSVCGCRGTLCCWCGCCGDCDACTDVCVACMYSEIMLGCEGDGNAGVVFGGGVVVVSAYMAGTHGSGDLSSACGMLEMSVVRGVGGVCDMCMCIVH